MKDNNVGERIQYYRKNLGYSVKDLAQRANITSSMLSQIERGMANPSINTLRTIATALNVAVFQLFLEDDVQAEDLIVTPEKRIRIIPPHAGERGVTYELLVPDLKGNIEFTILTLEPGCKSNRQMVTHIGEEVNYVLEGTLTFYYKNDVYTLNAGDSVRVLPHTPHLWHNETDQVAKLIFASTPTSF